MNISPERILSNALALALIAGIAGLAACGGSSSSGGGGTQPVTAGAPSGLDTNTLVAGSLMGGSIQGTALSLSAASATPVVSTLAGSATAAAGVLDGTGAAARFDWASGMTTDGINLYVVEDCGVTGNNDIRKIVIATGEVTTLAGSAKSSGSADGTGTAALFYCPWGITTDGSSLFVTDYSNHTIRKITPSSGTLSAMTSANAVVTTLAGTAGTSGAADGTGTAARFYQPIGITTDGNSLYVSDGRNNKIRRIAPSSGSLSAMTSATAVVTSITGLANTASSPGAVDGPGSTATFGYAPDITTDGFSLYVVDATNNKILKITPSSGTLSAITNATAVVSSITGLADTPVTRGAADGVGTTASFKYPWSITTDGSHLYVSDNGNNKIRMITPTSGTLSAMTSATAVVSSITGAANTAVTPSAADGAAATASFSNPYGITTNGNSLYVVDEGNNTIRRIH
jgi:hypothetical protein